VRVDIAWWELDGTRQTIESLRAHLRDDAPPWADVPGLRLKFWVADEEHNRWGAVMVWESAPPATLPPNRAAELIGRRPDHRLRFDVEAVIEGSHDLPVPHGLGPAPA
jgi:trans-2,3-dihydro-3-hydroxyanthranilate isomerase